MSQRRNTAFLRNDGRAGIDEIKKTELFKSLEANVFQGFFLMPAEVVTELVSAGCRFCFIVHNQIDNRHDIGKEDSKYRFSISALN